MTKLQQKMKSLGLHLLRAEQWDDCIDDLLTEEDIDNHFNEDNNVLIIDPMEAEISYVKIYGVEWQVCYRWVPLWRMNNWTDCSVDNWRSLYPSNDFFAVPHDDTSGSIDEDKGRQLLEENGFATSNFEGF